jgi:hypothetical protein
MACVRPPEELLPGQISGSGSGYELAGCADALGQGDMRPAQQPAWIIGERRGCGERGSYALAFVLRLAPDLGNGLPLVC